ncbi:MAG: sulfite exporter TauE/SafE family protein [Haloferacaceae archaeon]
MSEDGVEAPEIGAIARRLDEQSVFRRATLNWRHGRGVVLGLVFFVVALWALVEFVVPPYLPSPASARLLLPTVVLSAFVFETLDSAAGMGFGATIGTLLFLLGYSPDAVVPALLLSEAATGLAGGAFHDEFQNVDFGAGDDGITEATKVLALIAGTGVVAVALSVVMTYLAFEIPGVFVKIYVGAVIVVIALTTLAKKFVSPTTEYHRRRLIGFAALAGLNKGIAGSGYGPVITIGEILSGVYEKSATAITTMAEGVVSLAGILTFFTISITAYDLNLVLLPSVFAGGFLAAILAPYTVRVLPNRVLGYLVPSYALVLAGLLFLKVL